MQITQIVWMTGEFVTAFSIAMIGLTKSDAVVSDAFQQIQLAHSLDFRSEKKVSKNYL